MKFHLQALMEQIMFVFDHVTEHGYRSRACLFGIVGLVVAVVASPASAGLTLCNKSAGPVAAAVAFFLSDPEGVSTGGHRGGTVHGWSKINPGECKLIDRNVASAGTFYYFARPDGGGSGEWGGSSRLCVTDRKFSDVRGFLMGGGQCEPGYYSRGFERAPSTNGYEQRVDLSD